MKSPKEIFAHLDRLAVGQNDAKKAVSNAVYMHGVRYASYVSLGPIGLKKPNLLLMGPTGCGKTYLLEKAAEFAGFPFLRINARALTNTGYVGTTIETFLTEFHEECGDTSKFPFTIVFIDEIDKICPRGNDDRTETWQINLQYSLLKALEGYNFKIDVGTGALRRQGARIITDNMLFVLAGNFEGIRDSREKEKTPVGFAAKKKSKQKLHFQQELTNYGVVKELVGRIGCVAEVKLLTEKQLHSILTSTTDNVYDQYKKLFKHFGIDWKLTSKELKSIAKRAHKLKLGARGLSSILNEHIQEYVFDLGIDVSQYKPIEEYYQGFKIEPVNPNYTLTYEPPVIKRRKKKDDDDPKDS